MYSDIRWVQRFNNFCKALSQLQQFVEKFSHLNELEKQGMIKSFEYTYELAWNTLKDFYEYQGEKNIQGSRDAIQLAIRRNLISNGNQWMQMILDRNLASHTYNEPLSNQITQRIYDIYYLFSELKSELEKHIQ